MQVVTYLTSTLLIAVSVGLVLLAFRYEVRRRRSLHELVNSRELVVLDDSEIERDREVSVPHAGVAAHTADLSSAPPWHGLEGFHCQHTPAEECLHVHSKLALFSPALAGVVVHKGGELRLFGPCVGSVTVRVGGTCFSYGTVTGDALNEGGVLRVYGTIIGEVKTKQGATFIRGDEGSESRR
ncbi:hypothetical protein [Caldimonas brevitalea]|uniref:Uncharacterized protein n=1 Tax=Caldimonas brevitalea TaxID=413882 RepID=A0A0G3BRN4_9BURK|nr:hypothetical protein [Caldimonas brevitalea]AKJ29200.1 hypothetical protein AAW51_2509 [Caldimonas brevitalea]